MARLVEVTTDNMEEIFDQMVDAQADELKKEQNTADDKKSVVDVLTKFRSYIKSLRFDLKCRQKAKDKGYSYKNYKIFKRGIVKTILQKIADVFGLAVCVVGDILTYAVEFLSCIICRMVNFTVGICRKLINVLTLNCGTVL